MQRKKERKDISSENAGVDCDQWRYRLIENLNSNAEKSICGKLREIEKTLFEANKHAKV